MVLFFITSAEEFGNRRELAFLSSALGSEAEIAEFTSGP